MKRKEENKQLRKALKELLQTVERPPYILREELAIDKLPGADTTVTRARELLKKVNEI